MEVVLDQWLWPQQYWLPPGISWRDMKVEGGGRQPQPRDLLYTLPLALAFIVLRHAFDR